MQHESYFCQSAQSKDYSDIAKKLLHLCDFAGQDTDDRKDNVHFNVQFEQETHHRMVVFLDDIYEQLVAGKQQDSMNYKKSDC